MSLNLEISSCVRAVGMASNCVKCVDICPTNAIELSPHLPAFTPDLCVGCGGCVGACPTSAFSLTDFNTVSFTFSQFEKPEIISCKTNIPCLAIFGAEEMVSLALGSEHKVTMDIGHCSGCEIAQELYPQIIKNIEEANFILSTFGDKKIEAMQLKVSSDEAKTDESSRRDFLNVLKPSELAKQKAIFDNEVISDELKTFVLDETSISKIKNKNIPDKRKLLFAILKCEAKSQSYEVIDSNDISFTSQKYVDESCTNCQMCYRICPTGALGSVSNFSQINFDSLLCVKCHLCHDVCEPDAIHLQPTFEIKEFFEPTQRVLASFDIKRCNECGNTFTYNGGEQICQRCKSEEDEAMMLHQNARKLEEN
jgi:ferredoxin